MSFSTILQSIVKKISIKLLHDFNEIKYLKSSNSVSIMQFSQAAVRKYIEDFVQEIIKNVKINVKIILPEYLVILDTVVSMKQLLSEGYVLKKLKVIVNDFTLIIMTKEDDQIAGTMLLNPLDGLDDFIRGVSGFSTSLQYDTMHNEINHSVIIIYSPLLDEMFLLENDKVSLNNNKLLSVEVNSTKLDALFYKCHLLHIIDSPLCSVFDNMNTINNLNYAFCLLASRRYNILLLQDVHTSNEFEIGLHLVQKLGFVVKKVQISKNKKHILVASGLDIDIIKQRVDKIII